MESIHDRAAQYGIPMPALDHEERLEDGVNVISLTEESEKVWMDYMRSINMARLAMREVI